jgi:DNA topoisomerase-1
MMTIKTTKRKGTEKVCPIKNCGHAEPYEKPEEASENSETSEG